MSKTLVILLIRRQRLQRGMLSVAGGDLCLFVSHRHLFYEEAERSRRWVYAHC